LLPTWLGGGGAGALGPGLPEVFTAIGGVSHAAGVGGGGACETGGSSANCGGGGGEVVRRLGVLSVCGRFDSGATRSEFVTFAGSGFGGGLGSLGYLPGDPLVSPLPGGLNCDVSTNLFGLPVDSEGVEFMGTPVGGVVPGTVEVPLTCWMPEPPTFGCAELAQPACSPGVFDRPTGGLFQPGDCVGLPVGEAEAIGVEGLLSPRSPTRRPPDAHPVIATPVTSRPAHRAPRLQVIRTSLSSRACSVAADAALSIVATRR